MKRYTLLVVATVLAAIGCHAGTDPQAPAPQGPTEKAAYLGVATSPVGPALGHQLGLPKGVGLVIDYVDPDSPAQGKLEPHDVLHKLNDQILVSHQQLAVLVRSQQPGQEVQLSIIRGGAASTLKTRLAEKALPPLSPEAWHLPPIQFRPPMQGHEPWWFPRQGQPEQPHLKPGETGPDAQAPNGKDWESVEQELREMMEQARSRIRERGVSGDRLRALIDEVFEELERGTNQLQSSGPGPNRRMIRMQTAGQQNRLFTVVDNEHALSLTEEDGVKHLTVHDRDGRLLFDGPVTSEAEREKVPAAIRQKLDAVNGGGHAPLPADAIQGLGDKDIL